VGKRTAPRKEQHLRRKLPEYEAKRDFAITGEPAPGALRSAEKPTFVVHKHDATRLHYDVRLEMDDALASWSVPKGPSYDPAVKRLAIQTEDHPLEYGSFEGRIPDGEYGAGDSLIWDNGTCDSVPPGQLSEQRKKGRILVDFEGHKLKGEWHLVRTHGGAPNKPQWLMFKAKDGKERPEYDVVEERPESVVSGRRETRGPERKGALRTTRPAPEVILKDYFPPMLATLVDEPPRGEWHAEIKYDGYRALAALSNGRLAMQTRNQLDLTRRYPRIARALQQIVVGDAVIDGEICALDPNGVPRFELLQQGKDAVLFAFDLLRLDGDDLRDKPIEQRRDLLHSLLSNAPPELRVADEVPGDIADALEEVRKRGLEGLLLKARGSTYQKGRSRDWLKLKAQGSQELAIIGFTPGKGAVSGSLGALLLGVADGKGGYRFAGKVGTGFSAKQRRELQQKLSKDIVDKSPASDAPKLRDARWVEPGLVAQVRFTEWTSDGKLRHPAFQGLRDDKTPAESTREMPKQGTATEYKLTNPQRVLYPRDRLTKTDLANYYRAIAKPLLRALSGRPLTLVHYNQGIDKQRWFQQDIGKMREDWMSLVETPAQGKTVTHFMAEDERALAFLAQHSVLEIHAWHSRDHSLTQPDWVVFDLDPAEGRGIGQAVEVAQLLRGMFDRLGLPSVPKTSGKRGLHLYVPLAKGHTYDDAQSFALQVGETVEQQLAEVTLERSVQKRKGRLYFDCMQNAYGKTVVAPYSPRGIDGAPVSAPLLWDEVNEKLDPARWTLKTMPARLAEVGDLFEPALRDGIRLPHFKK
jgi:bifunctional non-homologous end joining protein LigD